MVLALQNPEGASKAVIMWDHQGHNNWWWAIDNIIVGTEEAITDGGEAPAITLSLIHISEPTRPY